MATTKTLINGKWHDLREYYKCLDLSEVYEESKQDCSDVEDNFINPIYDDDGYLISGEFDDDAMKTFLYECLDEEVDFIWEMIRNRHSCHDMHLINFDSTYLRDNHEIEVKLSDSLIVDVWVNIKFDIDHYVNNPRYNDGSGCYHQYRAYSVSVGEFKRIEKIKYLPAVA